MNHEIKAWEEHQMIVMDIHLDNFMAFKNFHMNMSYPKKIVNSSNSPALLVQSGEVSSG